MQIVKNSVPWHNANEKTSVVLKGNVGLDIIGEIAEKVQREQVFNTVLARMGECSITSEYLISFCFFDGDFLNAKSPDIFNALKQAKGVRGSFEVWLIYKQARKNDFLKQCFCVLFNKLTENFDVENGSVPCEYREIDSSRTLNEYVFFCRDIKALALMAEALGEYKTADKLLNYFNKLKTDCFERFFKEEAFKDENFSAKCTFLYFDLVPSHRKTVFAEEIKNTLEEHLNEAHKSSAFTDESTLCVALAVMCEYSFCKEAFALLKRQTERLFKKENKKGLTQTSGLTVNQRSEFCELTQEQSLACALSALLCEKVGGIDTKCSSDGFSHIVLSPCFFKEMDGFACRKESAYGSISVNWEIQRNRVIYSFNVPRSTTLILKNGLTKSFLAGEYSEPWELAD